MLKHKKKFPMQLIYSHVMNNIREYFSVIIVLLIGIVLGAIIINISNEDIKLSLQSYINDFITNISEIENIDKIGLLKNIFINNLLIVLTITFFGSTVIGIPIVYGIVAYKGFCLSYTIGSIIAVLGNSKGILFALSGLFLQNLIYIPCILALAVSGIKLYKSIVKDRRRENIKLEILRHILFSLVIGAVLLVGTLLEAYVSTNLIMVYSHYI